MGKAKGSIKTGGRQKGTPNKNTSNLIDVLNANDICIPEKIIELLPLLEVDKQVDTLLKLMAYIYPKKRPIEALKEPEQIKPLTIQFVSPDGSIDKSPVFGACGES